MEGTGRGGEVGIFEGRAVGDFVGGVDSGALVGTAVGALVVGREPGDVGLVGVTCGAGAAMGARLGRSDGKKVGFIVGLFVGLRVGGKVVGFAVGTVVGLIEGFVLGDLVGQGLGTELGEGDGRREGTLVGTLVGTGVGAFEVNGEGAVVGMAGRRDVRSISLVTFAPVTTIVPEQGSDPMHPSSKISSLQGPTSGIANESSAHKPQ